MVVSVTCLKAIALEPCLPLVGDLFRPNSHRDPVLALNIDVSVSIVITRLDLASKHLKDTNDLLGLLRVMKMCGLRLRQPITDRWHRSILARISDHGLQAAFAHPVRPRVYLSSSLKVNGLPLLAAETQIDVALMVSRGDFTTKLLQQCLVLLGFCLIV